MKKKMGFTLIEMIIVLVIVGIIAAFSSKLLSQGFSAYLTGKSVEGAVWQARLALARMALDFRRLRSRNDFITKGTNQFVFIDLTGTTITYQLTGSNLTRNGQTLATGVNNLNFNYYDSTGAAATTEVYYITYSFALNNTTLSYQSGIYFRNLS
jgi:prepilin-type N-terminal cleavage/methylation domain-containing protein